MRRALYAVALVGGLVGCAAGPTVDLEAERSALEARSAGIVAAEAAQDIDGAMAFWAADAIVQPAGSPQIQGHEAIRGLYGSFMGTGALKSFEGHTTQLELAASGDMAWESGTNRMVLAGPEGDLLDVGKYLAVWKKINGEWFITALSFTSDTPAPTAVAAQ